MQMLWPDRAGALSPAGVADAFEWPPTPGHWVRAVMVATADGAARSPGGRSGGISSSADRLVFATIRGLSDVILVGAQTVRTEGYGPPKARPELGDRRRSAGQEPLPRVAVVTASGNLDETSSLFTEATEPPIVLCPDSLPADRRRALEPVAQLIAAGEEQVDMEAAVDALVALDLHRIACEGGPRLLGQLLAADLVDDLCLTVTPLLFGGDDAEHAVPRILSGAVLADAPRSIHLDHVIVSDGTLFLRYTTSP